MTMRRIVVVGGAILMFVSVSAFAAIEFEFRRQTRSDTDPNGRSDVSARAWVDGDRSRLDYISGSIYPKGNYLLQMQGSRRLVIVDPLSKDFVEMNMTNVAAAVGSAPVRVDDLKTDVQKLDDHPVVAGHRTDHYRIHQSYDITVTFGSMSMRQSVNTVIDRWVTMAFGDVSGDYLSGGPLQTGNAELDKIILSESSKVPGFKMRETIAITTTSNNARGSQSKLAVDPVRRQSSEMTVTGVRLVDKDLDFFSIPFGFVKKTSTRTASERAPVHILSMEPEGSASKP